MDKKRWEEEYPSMPEAFHLAVKEAVENNLRKPKKHSPVKRNSMKKGLFLIAAAVLTLGAFAVTAHREPKSFNFVEYLQAERIENREDIFQQNIQVIVEEEPFFPKGAEEMASQREKLTDKAPLLEIRELMYDGMRLVLYGVPTEKGSKYELNADSLLINGKSGHPAETWHYTEKGDYYIITADQSTLEMKPPFEVMLPLAVYGDHTRYENQDLIFTVNTRAKIEYLEDQEFKFRDYTVEVTELRKSPLSLKGKVSVEMTEEQKQSYEAGEKKICGLLFKSGDEVLEFLNVTEEEQMQSDYNAGNMQWYFHRRFPENQNKKTVLYLMAQDKALLGEKFDITSMENCYGEGMELSIE